MNTVSHKHVTIMLKKAEKNPRHSSDLILNNMQSRHVPKEPQQPGSEIFSTFDLYLNIDLSPAMILSVNATPLGTCEKAKACEYSES